MVSGWTPGRATGSLGHPLPRHTCATLASALAASIGLQIPVANVPPRHRPASGKANPSYGAAKESNLPTRGLHGPAGFEDRMGHQTPAAPGRIIRSAKARPVAGPGS